MKRIAVLSCALMAWASCAVAQTPSQPYYGDQAPSATGPKTFMQPVDVNHPLPVGIGSSGGATAAVKGAGQGATTADPALVVSISPNSPFTVPTTPAPGQFGLGVVTSTALTVPTGATYAVVCARTQNVNWTTDGTTAPTSSVGTQLLSNNCVALAGSVTLSNFRAIQQAATATLDIQYWKP